MNKEEIIKKGEEYASENWEIETKPNEFDNCKDDFINGALWIVENLSLSSVSKRRELLIDFKDNYWNDDHEPSRMTTEHIDDYLQGN